MYSGGLSNYLYYVSLPPREESIEEGPEEASGGQPKRERLVSFSILNGADENNSLMSDDSGGDGNELALKQALKRRRYDSSSSALSGHQDRSEPQDVDRLTLCFDYNTDNLLIHNFIEYYRCCYVFMASRMEKTLWRP